MHASLLTRRASLLLPFVLAACGHEERTNFPPLRYQYLPPIRLNVASIDVQQRFYPSGTRPDVTALDPVHPVEALRAMAEDRLQALGSAGQAVFAITNATLTKQDELITCALGVVLEIYPTPGIRSGFAQAIASRQHSGPIDDLRGTLYDVTKAAMDAMNVEFEYQVRRNLGPWLRRPPPHPRRWSSSRWILARPRSSRRVRPRCRRRRCRRSHWGPRLWEHRPWELRREDHRRVEAAISVHRRSRLRGRRVAIGRPAVPPHSISVPLAARQLRGAANAKVIHGFVLSGSADCGDA